MRVAFIGSQKAKVNQGQPVLSLRETRPALGALLLKSAASLSPSFSVFLDEARHFEPSAAQ
jgi:hypothetical protein